MDEKKLEFLWKLFDLHLTRSSDSKIDEHISSKYETPLEFDVAVEACLDQFAISHNRSSLDRAIVSVVRRRYFDVTRHVQLVAILAGKELLSIDEAASLLIISEPMLQEIPSPVEHAVSVAWLVNEDRRDGIMKADADNLLGNALAIVAANFVDAMDFAKKERVQ